MDWLLLLSRLCIVVTIASNGGGIPVVVDIFRKGATHTVPFLPFIAGFISNTACVSYAMLKADRVLLIVSGVGVTMSTFYVSVYLFYSSSKNTTLRQLFLSGVGILCFYLYLTHIVREPSAVEIQLGILIGFLVTGMNVAPIANIGDILKRQSSEGLSISMALAIFVTSLLWVLYGIAVNDLILSLPSVSGVLSGLVQFYLLWRYPSKAKSLKTE